MRKLLWVAFAGLAVGVVVWAPWSPKVAAAAEVAADDLYTVRRDDLRVTLTENGTMVAKESQKVAAKIRGESKILFLVEEGKEVPEGEVVCKLDATQVQSQLEQVQLDIVQTEADLKAARIEVEIQIGENEAAVKKAAVALDRAKQEIEKYEQGEAPQEKKKLEVALKDAQTAFNRDSKNLEDSKKLLEQKYIKKSEVEDHEIAFERSKVQKEGAEVALVLFDKYTLPMTLEEKRTKVTDAERDAASASKRGESQLGQKNVKVQQLEKRLRMQNEQLQDRKKDVENMTLTAPCPGILVYGDPHEPWNRQQLKVGGQIWGGQTVMTIPDLRVMQVKLQIHEADISKLKLGLKATVTTDSYPGLQLVGEVSKIATVASGESNWGGSSEVKKFDVEVTLRTEGLQLRPGISAKCEIAIETRPQTLFVPLQAVFAEDGEHFCHTQGVSKAAERRKVKLGTSNDNWMEIVEGLAEGERVLLYNPMLLEGGKGAKHPADGGAGNGAGNGSRANESRAVEAAAKNDAPTAVPATASPTGAKTGS